MKSVRYWRLWHRLFGWDYAQITSAQRDGTDGRLYIRRARKLYNGRWYVRWWNGGNTFLDAISDDKWIPLTPFSTERDLKDYADLVQKQLQEE